tara:strand:+ start:670 stop:906 length:237 start_codon:yes stop_codon:yes gene_type:complete
MQSSFALWAVIILPLKLTAQTEDVLNPTPDKLPKNCKERRATEKNKVQAEDSVLVNVVVALPAKAELRKKIYKKLVFK